MVQVRKQDIAKWLYREDALDDRALDALTSDRPGVGVPVAGDAPLNDVIIPLPRNDANAQMFVQHSEIVESDIDRVTGVNEYMRGALPEVRRTATEASIIQDAANARAADKLAQIEGFAGEISKRLVMLAQTFMTSAQVARVVGPQGQMVWVPFTREDVEGEFDFEVEAGSTQPKNETFKRQQATQVMQTLQPFMGPPGQPGYINVPQLLSYVLREGFGVKNPEKFIQDPMAMMDPAMMGGMPPEQGMEEPMSPEQAMDPAMSGGPQPPPGPGVAPEQPAEGGIDGVPPEVLAQLQGQIGFSS
jgi:hypothetical protein